MALSRLLPTTRLLCQQRLPTALCMSSRSISADSTDLKAILADKIASERVRVKEFRQKCGSQVVGEVSVDMMYGGMRGIKGLVTETSHLDPEEGISFRGYTIPQLREKLPKAPGGEEPLPEGLFWLLLTGQLPTESQVKSVSRAWAQQADLPSHVVTLLNNLPASVHPMSQLSAAITACNTESRFVKAYNE
ncbi:putative citrate synthase 1, partial [Tropilaelaps mercedesae]